MTRPRRVRRLRRNPNRNRDAMNRRDLLKVMLLTPTTGALASNKQIVPTFSTDTIESTESQFDELVAELVRYYHMIFPWAGHKVSSVIEIPDLTEVNATLRSEHTDVVAELVRRVWESTHTDGRFNAVPKLTKIQLNNPDDELSNNLISTPCQLIDVDVLDSKALADFIVCAVHGIRSEMMNRWQSSLHRYRAPNQLRDVNTYCEYTTVGTFVRRDALTFSMFSWVNWQSLAWTGEPNFDTTKLPYPVNTVYFEESAR